MLEPNSALTHYNDAEGGPDWASDPGQPLHGGSRCLRLGRDIWVDHFSRIHNAIKFLLAYMPKL